MSSTLQPRHRRGAIPWPAALLLILLQVAGLVALAPLVREALGGDPGALGLCGEGTGADCDQVLASRWSQWLGLPVSILGATLYVVMLCATLAVCTAPAARVGTFAGLILRAAATLAAVFAFWMVALQLFWIRSVCPYCMATHACSLAIAATLLCCRPRPSIELQSQGTRDALQAVLKQSRTGPRAPAHTQQSDTGNRPLGTRRLWQRPALWGLVAGTAAIVVQCVFPGPQPRMVVQQADEITPLAPPRVSIDSDQPSAGPKLTDSDSGDPVEGSSRSDEPDPRNDQSEAAETQSPSPAAAAATNPPEAAITSATRPWTILGGKRTLDVTQFPRLGAADAEFLVGKLFDYCCPHCRELDRQLALAQPRYGDRLAIVLIPVPLNAGCNRAITQTYPRHTYACLYAKLALTVWKENPDRFTEFHRWLFQSVDPPEPAEAKREARRILDGRDPLELSAQPWVDEQLEKCIDLYEVCGSRGIPKLILGSAVAKGIVKDVDELCEVLETNLGIKPLPDPQAAGSLTQSRRSLTQRR